MYDYETTLKKHLGRHERKQTQIAEFNKLEKTIIPGQNVWIENKDAIITSINSKTVVLTLEDGRKIRKLITQIPSLRLPIPGSKKIPSEILEIKKWWDQQVELYVQQKNTSFGSAVIGAKLYFRYKSEFYLMYPLRKYQGEFTWASSLEQVKKKLHRIGCRDIEFDQGMVD